MNEVKNARSTIINALTALSQSFKYSYMNKDENPKRAENSSICKMKE